MQDDLIDFPVSDLWRDHYAAQGLTYPSGRYPKPAPTNADRDRELRDLKSLVQTLRDQLAELTLTAQHPHLKETNSNTPKTPPKTFEE